MRGTTIGFSLTTLAAAMMGATAVAAPPTGQGTTPPYTVSASQACEGTCIEACATVSCNEGDVLVGGGGGIQQWDPPGNTQAGDNVALQFNGPSPGYEGTTWVVCGRELQNTPGAGGRNADGTTGGQVPADCVSNPSSCFVNWNSSTPPSQGGVGPVSINATNTTWAALATVICEKKPKGQPYPENQEGESLYGVCVDPGDPLGTCLDED